MNLNELALAALASKKALTEYENSLFSGDNLEVMINRLQTVCKCVVDLNCRPERLRKFPTCYFVYREIIKLTIKDLVAKVDPIYSIDWIIDYNTKEVYVEIHLIHGKYEVLRFPILEDEFNNLVERYNVSIKKVLQEENDLYKTTFQERRKKLLEAIYEFQESYPDEMKGIREEM